MLADDAISPDARLVLIAANPRSGARSSREVVGQLAAALNGQRLEARVITDLDELALAANEAQRAGRLRAVVAAGGDGTLAELVNRTSADTPLAVFPLGTANLMANYLGLLPRPDQFATMLAAGQAVRLDAARAWATPIGADGATALAAEPAAGSAGRIFLIVAGVGFDAAVVAGLHSQRAGHIRMWTYAKPIWDCVRSYSYPRLRCECAWTWSTEDVCSGEWTEVSPGFSTQLVRSGCEFRLKTNFEASWLFVQNLPCYAGGLQFAPRANGRDGLLDVCALKHGSFWHGLRYLGYVLAGSHEELPDCRMERVKRIRVTSDAPTPVQLDGDPGGQLPLEIESLPRRVRIIVPGAGWEA